MTKKGIELPGREGRWEVERVYRNLKGGDDLTHRCFSGGDHVVLRLLPEENPMPEIGMFNGIEWRNEIGDAQKGIVTNTNSKFTVTVRDLTGRQHFVHRGEILVIRADGERVWNRRTS